MIKERYGNDTKFIILTFEYTHKHMWETQLKEMGIDVIDISDEVGTSDLINSVYFEPKECRHPNGKLWKELVPKLKKMYPDL